MSRFAVRPPSAALLISLLALFVSLSGVGYAAVVLAPNSVGTAQLKDNAVTSPKVANGTLKSRDLAAGVLPPSGAIVRTRLGQVPLGTEGPVLVTVLTASGIPKGSYVFTFRTDVVNLGTGGELYMRCQVEAPFGTVRASGTTYAASPEVPVNQMTLVDAMTLTTTTTVRVRCWHDYTTALSPYVENSRLVLVKVRTVSRTAVTS